jgi:fucose 4-O-acetylase-like acetyltransferase
MASVGHSVVSSGPEASARDVRFDVLRGVAICLVVFGHLIRNYTGTGSAVSAVIYAFHMPLFVLLSGYLAFKPGRRAGWRWLGGKARQLLLPYVVFVTLSYVLGFAWSDVTLKPLVFAGRSLLYADAAWWFLYVLFGCFVLLALCQLVPGRLGDLFLVVVAAALWLTYRLTGSQLLGLSFLHWYFTFFAMAYLFAKYRSRLPRMGWLAYVAGFAVFPVLMAMALHITPAPWFRSILQKQPALMTVGVALALALTGAALAVAVSLLLARTPLSRMFAFLGRKTLDLYLLTSLFIGVYLWDLHGKLPLHVEVSLAATVAVIVVALGASWLIGRSPELATVILGHPYQRRDKEG